MSPIVNSNPISSCWRRFVLALVIGLPALSGLAPPAALAQPALSREIWVQNACNRPMRLLIHHADQYRNWHPHAWWQFNAYEGPSRLLWEGRPLYQLSDHDLYFYGETLDGAYSWSSSSVTASWQGVTYGLVRASLMVVEGRFQLNLTCN